MRLHFDVTRGLRRTKAVLSSLLFLADALLNNTSSVANVLHESTTAFTEQT